eukprot:scaffold412_cov388-Prasinococcus_capsulatus_cf.AAC.13
MRLVWLLAISLCGGGLGAPVLARPSVRRPLVTMRRRGRESRSLSLVCPAVRRHCKSPGVPPLRPARKASADPRPHSVSLWGSPYPGNANDVVT